MALIFYNEPGADTAGVYEQSFVFAQRFLISDTKERLIDFWEVSTYR